MLTAKDFTRLPLQMWERVFSKVKKAVVFIDDKCAEALHWSGGAAALFEAGARNLKQFSSFEACSANEPKAVFVVSTLLKGRTIDIIKDIITLSHFQYCVVFTTVAHSVHLLANNVTAEMEGNPVFQQFEEKLCEWMGNMNYTAEVMHVPVVFAPVSQQLILTPPFSHLFPLLSPDLETINAKRPEKKRFGSLVDIDINSLPTGLQIQVKHLVSALNSMFEATGTREESFAVGPMSRIIAGELANHSHAKNRRKTAQNKASIIFIDRTLDLTGEISKHLYCCIILYIKYSLMLEISLICSFITRSCWSSWRQPGGEDSDSPQAITGSCDRRAGRHAGAHDSTVQPSHPEHPGAWLLSTDTVSTSQLDVNCGCSYN